MVQRVEEKKKVSKMKKKKVFVALWLSSTEACAESLWALEATLMVSGFSETEVSPTSEERARPVFANGNCVSIKTRSSALALHLHRPISTPQSYTPELAKSINMGKRR